MAAPCETGTDTVSLARLGASMTGLDFSAAAVEAARQLAQRTGADAHFVQADLYDAPDVLGPGGPSGPSGPGGFDLVVTGIGPSAGSRTSAAGLRWSPRCCGPAGGCSSARPTR